MKRFINRLPSRFESFKRSATNHTPDAVAHHDIEQLRRKAIDFAAELDRVCPDSREASLAFTHLEETVMWAVKSIVLSEPSDTAR